MAGDERGALLFLPRVIPPDPVLRTAPGRRVALAASGTRRDATRRRRAAVASAHIAAALARLDHALRLEAWSVRAERWDPDVVDTLRARALHIACLLQNAGGPRRVDLREAGHVVRALGERADELLSGMRRR